MPNYRKVTWRRNVRKLPDAVQLKLKKIHSPAVVAMCVKPISLADIDIGLYEHLSIRLENGQIAYEESLLPSVDMGPYSKKNAEGWERRRTDLPMIKKSIYVGDRPKYGDWSNGSFALWQEREVFQREFHQPRDCVISLDLIKLQVNSPRFVRLSSK